METLGPQVTTLSPTHVEGARRGIQLSFILLEPVVYLQRSGTRSNCKNNPAVLRGSLHLKITEPTKIRGICVYFHGLAQFRLWGGMCRPARIMLAGLSSV